MNDDRPLRQRFEDLRDEEKREVPSFQSLTVPRSYAPWGLVRGIAAAALLLFAGIAVMTRRERPERPVEMVRLPQWQAPTDFLLQTPGIELVRSTPQFGVVEPPVKGTS